MKHSYYNVFGGDSFLGNSACVIEIDALVPIHEMQEVAEKINLPATSFIFYSSSGWQIRWFSSRAEIQLCGHGTIAAAAYLFNRNKFPDDKIIFKTNLNQIVCRKKEDLFEMELPTRQVNKPNLLFQKECFGLNVEIISIYQTNNSVTLLEVENESQVKSFVPNFDFLTRNKVTLLLTARGQKCDFVFRYFAPSYGSQEDDGTGSAQAILGPYWSKKIQKKEFTSYQLSKRGGTFKSEVIGDFVLVRGNCYPTHNLNR